MRASPPAWCCGVALVLALAGVTVCAQAPPPVAPPAATPGAASAPGAAAAPAAGARGGRPDGARGVRHDDDPRQDGEHRRRHRRFRDHGEFGPPTVPAGVQVPTWSQLTPEQQQQLAHLREHWDQMPASRRVHALERIERHARWDALTPEQRERLRDGARNFRELPPELREKMRASLQATRDLPEEERRRLFDRWHQLSPEQRRAWLEAGGPGIAPEPPAD